MQNNNSMVLGQFNLCFSQVLGKGATGIVYKGYRNADKIPVAIKCIQLSTIKDDVTRCLLENEKSALKKVNNPNIIKLLDIIETNDCCYIITQICQGQTLKQYISKKVILSQEQAMTIFRKILNGCLHMTQNCIIHRDLKPTNILLNGQLQPKIIDFGYCQIITQKKVMRTFNVGSPSYMSPQAYLRTLYSQKSDSWSLGIILYEMLHGNTPDNRMPIKQYLENVKNNPFYIKSMINSSLDKNVIQILQKSLKYAFEERMSISGMKYLADVFNIQLKKNKNQDNRPIHNDLKSLNNKNNSFGFTSIRNLHDIQEQRIRQNRQIMKTNTNTNIQIKTLKSISNESSSNSDKYGFMSFAQFSKTSQSFSNQNKKTNYNNILNGENYQNSSSQINIQPPNQNHMSFINRHKQSNYSSMNNNYIPHQSINLYQGINGLKNYSSKEIIEKKIGKPAFRQVTVRYL